MHIIESLCSNIEKRWSEYFFSQGSFSKIASEYLSDLTLSELRLQLTDINFLKSKIWLEPHGSNNVYTIYKSSYFSSYIHFWFDELATPHHHSWEGVFMVLEGHVLHNTYIFSKEEYRSNHITLGNLNKSSYKELKPGDIIEVAPGESYIHSLWHVSNPCISLSFRSNLPSKELTIDYRWGVSWQLQPSSKTRQFEMLLNYCSRTNKNYIELIEELAKTNDPAFIFQILYNQIEVRGNEEFGLEFLKVDKAMEFFSEKSVTDLIRTSSFKKIRSATEDEDLRYFFGLLYTQQTKKDLRLRLGADHRFKLATCLAKITLLSEHSSQEIFSAIESFYLKYISNEYDTSLIKTEDSLPKENIILIEENIDTMKSSPVFDVLFSEED